MSSVSQRCPKLNSNFRLKKRARTHTQHDNKMAQAFFGWSFFANLFGSVLGGGKQKELEQETRCARQCSRSVAFGAAPRSDSRSQFKRLFFFVARALRSHVVARRLPRTRRVLIDGSVRRKRRRTVRRLLLDTVLLNKPLLLTEGCAQCFLKNNVLFLSLIAHVRARARAHSGFVVYAGLTLKKKTIIKSLDDLKIGLMYTTEKETTLFRRSENELILSGKKHNQNGSFVVVRPCVVLRVVVVFFHKKKHVSLLCVRADRIIMPIVMPTNETMVDGTLYLVMRGRLLPQTMQLALEHFTRQKLSDGITLRELETQNTLRVTQIEQLEEGL